MKVGEAIPLKIYNEDCGLYALVIPKGESLEEFQRKPALVCECGKAIVYDMVEYREKKAKQIA